MDCTPEMRRVELQPGDFAIVLASDGLWDVLSDTEVVTILQKVRLHHSCYVARYANISAVTPDSFLLPGLLRFMAPLSLIREVLPVATRSLEGDQSHHSLSDAHGY